MFSSINWPSAIVVAVLAAVAAFVLTISRIISNMTFTPVTYKELLEAAKVVIKAKVANTSIMQGKLGVGYAKAHQLLNELEKHEIITEERVVRKRDLRVYTLEEAIERIMGK